MTTRLHCIVLAAMVLIVPVLILAACATPPAPASAKLGEQISLAIGQSATVSGEGLTVSFDDLTADSRCPDGAKCIWAGQAVCELKVTSGGSTSSVTLTVLGGTASTSSQAFGPYRLDFKVTPYPKVGEQIARADYRLLLTVTKPA